MPTIENDKFSEVFAKCNMDVVQKTSANSKAGGTALPEGEYTAVLDSGSVSDYEDGDRRFPLVRLNFTLEATPIDPALEGRTQPVWYRLGPSPKTDGQSIDSGNLKSLFEKLFDEDIPTITAADGEEVDDVQEYVTRILTDGIGSRWAIKAKKKGEYTNIYVNDLLADE